MKKFFVILLSAAVSGLLLDLFVIWIDQDVGHAIFWFSLWLFCGVFCGILEWKSTEKHKAAYYIFVGLVAPPMLFGALIEWLWNKACKFLTSEF